MYQWICFIVLFGSYSFGQPGWSLEQCIDSALLNSSEVRLSNINLRISEVQDRNAIYTFLPSLNAGASHGYNWGQTIDPFTNEFATNRVQYNNFYLNSSVTLFSGLQNYYSKKILDREVQVNELNKEITKRNKIIEVTTAYLQVQLNLHLLRLSQNHIELTEQQLGDMIALNGEKFNTTSDVIQIEAQLASDQYNLVRAESDLQQSLLILQELIGKDYDSSFSINGIVITNTDQYTNTGLEIELITAREKQQQLKIKQTKSQYSPRIALNGSLGSGYSGNNTFQDVNGEFVPKPFGTQLNENFYQSVSGTLVIPIFNNNRTKSQVKINQLEAGRIKVENEELLRLHNNRVIQLKIDINANTEKLNSLIKLVEAYEADYNNNEFLFKDGNISYFELKSSKAALFQAQSELEQTKFRLEFNKLIFDLLK